MTSKMNDKDRQIERSRLISGGAFADPNHKIPHTPAEFDYYWNAYLASGEVECLAKAIEIIQIYGNDQITKEIAKILRDRKPTKKFEKTFLRRETDVLHKHLRRSNMKKEAIYRHLSKFNGTDPDSIKRDIMRRRKKVIKK